jgi:hypothetical protein
VILVDLTCKLARTEAGRWIDPEQRLCALRLGGWTPNDLLLHDAEESARDRAEGERLAYVAATRARDVLVVPAIGDEVYEGGWLDPLMPAVYPSLRGRRDPAAAAGCPVFPSRDSVLTRADGDPAKPSTVSPGSFRFTASQPAVRDSIAAWTEPLPARAVPGAADDAARPARATARFPGNAAEFPGDAAAPNSKTGKDSIYDVVWWDPRSLVLEASNAGGLRRDDLITKDGDQAGVERRMGEYRAWQANRAAAVARGKVPSLVSRTASDLARLGLLTGASDAVRVTSVDLPRTAGRPFGPRFGSLVHATLATVALDADAAGVLRVAQTHARLLVADAKEARAAAETVSAALAHPLFARVRAASAAGRCARECPLLWRAPDGSIVEGAVDVVFEEDGELYILDFKTDREPSELKEQYQRQLTLYCRAFAELRRRPHVHGILVQL